MAILMCRPDHFGVEYEINPWMKVANAVDHARALAQWEALYQTYRAMGETVELVDPVGGLPDMVFTANAGVIWKGDVVLSHFHHRERQGEEPHFERFFESRGFRIHRVDPAISMEGAGDFLLCGDTLFAGTGFRTDEAAHRVVADLLGLEAITLHLTDPRFYHLDTCFAPLDAGTALINPRAFTPESVERIRTALPRVVEATEEAAAGFVCNAMTLGQTVVSSPAIELMRGPLEELGFTVVGLPVSEFMKSGGGVRCLTLPLDMGLTARAAQRLAG